MPIDIGWLVEKRVSYFDYHGDITAEELQLATRIGLELLEQVDAPLLHTVQNSDDIDSFPMQIGSVNKIVRESLSHPKMGWIISVGIQSDIIRFVAGLVTKMMKTRSRIVEDIDEAKTFLNYVDTSLIDLKTVSLPTKEQMLYHIVGDQVIEVQASSTIQPMKEQ
ncbi:MAG: hypothetical protein AAFV93_15290 [Chloroflexota bacterium]